MAIDPFPNIQDSTSDPYDNGESVDLDALLEGPMALSNVSSALWVGARGPWSVTVEMFGGQEVTFSGYDTTRLPIRVVSIVGIPDPGDGRELNTPASLVALW